ncbi:polymorphic toxin-type HINT domain-containing protein [Peterkaempfera bronchialis]|uniref:polymorphic toxin-type HINT domain-containing protein n=1 Tax=Peterkaempfera bronchialis TaxID=2126346 RepID=UPI003C2BF285
MNRIEIGDEVIATDPDTGRTESRTVTSTIYNPNDTEFADIAVKTGGSSPKITATWHHPFWSPSAHAWIDAGDLKPGLTPSAPPTARPSPSPTSSATTGSKPHTTSPPTTCTRTMYSLGRRRFWFITVEDAFPLSGTGAASGSSSGISPSCWTRREWSTSSLVISRSIGMAR